MTGSFKITHNLVIALIVFAVTANSLVAQEPRKLPAQNVPPCSCDFRIESDFEQVKAGEVAEFRIVSDDPKLSQKEFKWAVSLGNIISGQGTRTLKVQTSLEMLETRRAEQVPTPVPPDGFFSDAFTRSRSMRFSVTAGVADPNCTCPDKSLSIRIGRMSVPSNKPADLNDLKLSADELVLPCSPGTLPVPGGPVPSESMVLDVTADASDPENDVLTYHYTVSAGGVVGKGPKVKWDLSGVAPGYYTITSGVADECGLCGKTQSRSVTVAECTPTCVFCECPSIEIQGPRGDVIYSGENTFTANVSGGTQSNPITFEWSVENGEILHGQRTPSIHVNLFENVDFSLVNVRLRIRGAPDCSCPTEQVITYENGRLRKP